MADQAREQIDELVNRGLLNQWYAVAKSVQVKPSKPHAVKALGRDLVLWRDAGGNIQCLEDYCPHRGARLSRGEVLGDGPRPFAHFVPYRTTARVAAFLVGGARAYESPEQPTGGALLVAQLVDQRRGQDDGPFRRLGLGLALA